MIEASVTTYEFYKYTKLTYIPIEVIVENILNELYKVYYPRFRMKCSLADWAYNANKIF